jgi:hypothetical protein
MNKVLLSLLFLSVSILGVEAQGGALGIKGGVNFANQDIETITTNSITGFHGGIFASLMFTETLGLQPELLFSSQGSELELDNFDDVKNEFNYITIPLLLKIKPGEIINLYLGPQIGFLTSATKNSEDVKDLYNTSDFSLVFGAGFELFERLELGARYNLGLSDINDNDPELDDIEIKNRMFQVYAGIKLVGNDD